MNRQQKSQYIVKSSAESMANTYVIPYGLVQKQKNAQTIFKTRDDKDDKTAADSYFFRTTFQSKAGHVSHPTVKPKIKNQLHLQFPSQQKTTIKRYVGQQKQFEQSSQSFFHKIFKCCMKPVHLQNYKQCDYCQQRIYQDQEHVHKRQQQQGLEEKTQPYISYRRLKQREKQPVRIFFQTITNEDIKNNRYDSMREEGGF